jgi:adenosylcobinamide-GDP ribazoletransferase
MKKQLDIFFTAVMFLTRLPVPKRIDHSPIILQKSARYFPWVGMIVGLIAAATYTACVQILSPALSVFFSMIVSILTTGAFHEDGFADVCDAFGGGWTKEKILLIMKDSRLGTYGVIGLISILGLKFLLLFQLSGLYGMFTFVVLIITGNTSSRFAALTILQQYNYVSDPDTSKAKPLADRKLSFGEMVIAIVGGGLSFLLLKPVFLLAIIPIVFARLYLGNYFNKWIGGYTGDCLGATQQVCEIVFYLGSILIWKFT